MPRALVRGRAALMTSSIFGPPATDALAPDMSGCEQYLVFDVARPWTIWSRYLPKRQRPETRAQMTTIGFAVAVVWFAGLSRPDCCLAAPFGGRASPKSEEAEEKTGQPDCPPRQMADAAESPSAVSLARVERAESGRDGTTSAAIAPPTPSAYHQRTDQQSGFRA